MKFALIGAGWRAEFFVRIAKALPEVFELTSVLVRKKEKGIEFAEKFQVNVVSTLEEVLEDDIDFVVLSIKSDDFRDYLPRLYRANVPVLCETPPSFHLEDLELMWEDMKQYEGKIQVAEQYLFQPLYGAWNQVIQDGKLGEIQNINISALHGYHGVSIIRAYLGVGYENCKIEGKRFTFDVTKTDGREGPCFTGELMKSDRDRVTLEFENGKVAFFDFAGVQYHTFIRTRQLNIQGTRGEIDDLEVRYLTEENIPVQAPLRRVDIGVYNNQGWDHQGIMLNETYLYKNPFPMARLNDDEIAVATCMYKMKAYIEEGVEFYSFKDALQDAYISIKMSEAIRKSGEQVETSTQSWARE